MVYNYDAVKVHYNFLDRAVRRLSVQEQSPDVRRDVANASSLETTPVVGALSLLVIRTSIRDKNLSLFVAYIGGHTSVEGIHTTRVNHSANLRS